MQLLKFKIFNRFHNTVKKKMGRLEDAVRKLDQNTDRVIKNANTKEEDVENSIKYFGV